MQAPLFLEIIILKLLDYNYINIWNSVVAELKKKSVRSYCLRRIISVLQKPNLVIQANTAPKNTFNASMRSMLLTLGIYLFF